MTRPLLAGLLLLTAIVVAGCSKQEEQAGYSKSDFAPRPAPAGYGPPKGGPAAPK